jgi:transposase
MLEAICWRFHVGAPWRELPTESGPRQTVWKRHFRWSTDGTYQRIFEAVQGAAPAFSGTATAVGRCPLGLRTHSMSDDLSMISQSETPGAMRGTHAPLT